MVSQIQLQTQPEVIYPDSDGQPVANNTEQFRWILVIQQNLAWLYANDPNVFVAGDLFWYPVQGRKDIVNAPDVMVVFGRTKGKRGSYQQWNEGGIAPQVVFEILSPSNTQNEMERKLLFYERYGVEEYYIYDPERHQFRVWNRTEAGLDVIESGVNWVSPRLGIRFDPSGEELQIYRPDGTKFFSYIEISQLLEERQQQLEQQQQRAEAEQQRAEAEQQRAEAEQQRAEAERQRAESERQRAESERQRAEDLEDLLRQYRERFGELLQ